LRGCDATSDPIRRAVAACQREQDAAEDHGEVDLVEEAEPGEQPGE
jgi:hypothetical protein